MKNASRFFAVILLTFCLFSIGLQKSNAATTVVGAVDGVTADGKVTGWAANVDATGKYSDWVSLNFMIDPNIVNGGLFGNKWYGIAMLSSPDVNASNPLMKGNFRFTFQIPKQYMDGNSHKVYVLSQNAQITGSPISFTLPAVTGSTPVGAVDAVKVSGLDGGKVDGSNITGWAVDPTNPSKPTTVEIYTTSTNGFETYVGKATADQASTDVTAAHPAYTGNHRFSFAIPRQYADGFTHSFFVRALNIPNTVAITIKQPYCQTQSWCNLVQYTENVPSIFVDSIKGGVVSGWGLKESVQSTSFYIDNFLANGGTVSMVPRSDLTTIYPAIAANLTGFQWRIPSVFNDGKKHVINFCPSSVNCSTTSSSVYGLPKYFMNGDAVDGAVIVTPPAPVVITPADIRDSFDSIDYDGTVHFHLAKPITASEVYSTAIAAADMANNYSHEHLFSNQNYVHLTLTVDKPLNTPGAVYGVDNTVIGPYAITKTMDAGPQTFSIGKEAFLDDGKPHVAYLYITRGVPGFVRSARYVNGVDFNTSAVVAAAKLLPGSPVKTVLSGTGVLDGVTRGVVTGWAVDPFLTTVSIPVDLYIDGPAGAGGVALGRVQTNDPSPDINAAFPTYTGNHRFSYTIPAQYLNDGKQHSVYAYGIRATGSKNYLLDGSPKTFTGNGSSISAPVATTVSCLRLGADLASGQTSGDVTSLQTFLKQSGYLTVAPTGYYGPATEAAVKSFQAANGISQTGGVGPLTRAKIQSLSCGNTIAPTPIPTPTPTPAPTNPVVTIANKTPVGVFDGVINGVASGWAVDPDAPGTPIYVDLYVDGAYGSGGTMVAHVFSNSPSADVTAANSTYTGNHRFVYQIPAKYQDGKLHTIYAYGIDSAGGANVAIGGNPKSFTIGTVTTQPVTTTTTNTNTTTATAPVNHNPIGILDGVVNTTISGWAVDTDVPGTPISVDVYVDGGPATGGTMLARVLANSPSPDVTAANPTYTGNHRFVVTVPSQYQDGKQHSVYAYGIDSAGGPNAALGGNPKTFTLGTAAVTNTVQPSLTILSPNGGEIFKTGDSMTIRWAQVGLGDVYVTLALTPSPAQAQATGVSQIGIIQGDVTIDKATAASGQYIWKIPSTVPSGAEYKIGIAVKAPNGQIITDDSNSNFSVIQPVVAVNHQPVGAFDGVAGLSLTGWAYDQDAGTSPISVDIYVDGPVGGGGTAITRTSANQPRPDVAVTYPGDHGFSFAIPSKYWDGLSHTAYAYAIDSAGGFNPALAGNPKSFTVTKKYSPVGFNDGITTAGVASGWSVDPDVPSIPISVDIYVDGGPATGGTMLARVLANSPSPDVTAAAPAYTGNHRYLYTIPTQYRDGKPHTLSTYGIDATGNPNVVLGGSPKTFTLAPVTASASNTSQFAGVIESISSYLKVLQSLIK